MSCKRCRERVKDWAGSNPKCAFGEDGNFQTDNWRCSTLSVLRGARPKAVVASGDCSALVLPFPERCSTGDETESHVVLQWYKSRGKTQLAFVIEGNGSPRLLKISEAELLADHYERQLDNS